MKLLEYILDKKKLVIFDFDGVLVDSVNVKTEAFGLMYKDYGLDVVKKVHDHHIENGGLPRFEKFKHYHKNFLGKNLNEDGIQEMSNQFSKMVVEKVVSADWIPGAEKFLKTLYKHKINCIVVSATPQNEIELIIKKRNMNIYFSSIYGSPTSKNENLLSALNKNSVYAKDAIFFGDALADWQASSKSDIQFVGIGKSIRDLLNSNNESVYFFDDFNGINQTSSNIYL